MLKKFLIHIAGWFFIYLISLWLANLGWAEQGKAFLYIHLGSALVILVMSDKFKDSVYSLKLTSIIIYFAVLIGYYLLGPWICTKLFNIDFYLAYQIIVLGSVLEL